MSGQDGIAAADWYRFLLKHHFSATEVDRKLPPTSGADTLGAPGGRYSETDGRNVGNLGDELIRQIDEQIAEIRADEIAYEENAAVHAPDDGLTTDQQAMAARGEAGTVSGRA
jgi:hypothetical protein